MGPSIRRSIPETILGRCSELAIALSISAKWMCDIDIGDLYTCPGGTNQKKTGSSDRRTISGARDNNNKFSRPWALVWERSSKPKVGCCTHTHRHFFTRPCSLVSARIWGIVVCGLSLSRLTSQTTSHYFLHPLMKFDCIVSIFPHCHWPNLSWFQLPSLIP